LLPFPEIVVIGAPRPEARAVRKKVADRHLLLPVRGELREEIGDRLVETDLPLCDEEHHRGGRCHHLGEGGEVVNRVGACLAPLGRERSRPEDALVA
jgi:hypothetical protein